MSNYDADYDGSFRSSQDEERNASRESEKKRPNWVIIVLSVIVIGGIGLLIYKLLTNYRREKCSNKDSAPEPQVPSAHHGEGTHNPQQPHPVMHQFPIAQQPGKSLSVIKAEQLFGVEAMKHLEVLNMASMASLIVQTPDLTSIELARDGQAQIRQMVGMQPLPYKHKDAMVMIMIYTSTGNCPTCQAAAPKFTRAAVSAQLFYSKTPNAPLFKFAVIDYADMPIYMAKHFSVAPSFLFYNPVDKAIERANVKDLNLLDSRIMGLYKSISDQM